MAALLTPKEAAAYLKVSLTTLRALEIPRVRLTERTVRYRVADLDRYAEDKCDEAAA